MMIYLAARYSRHPEMQGYAADLRAMGHEVTSRWILGDHELRSDGQSDTDWWAVRWAQEDWEDLLLASVVVSFTEAPGNVPGRARGGRHVEFGAALALRKLPAVQAAPDEFAEAEMRADLRALLLGLSPRQRAALLLVDLLGYPSEQAARILRVRPSTVRNLASQGRRNLRATEGARDA